VEWRLETGRTHQIRVHAREIGIPILGDETYGGAGNGAEERLRSKGAMTPAEAKRVAKISHRPMLHAQTLGFRHPRTGEEMDFKAEPPEDFAEVFEALRDASA
jgi:tRNA pseudouridine synthase 2